MQSKKGLGLFGVLLRILGAVILLGGLAIVSSNIYKRTLAQSLEYDSFTSLADEFDKLESEDFTKKEIVLNKGNAIIGIGADSNSFVCRNCDFIDKAYKSSVFNRPKINECPTEFSCLCLCYGLKYGGKTESPDNLNTLTCSNRVCRRIKYDFPETINLNQIGVVSGNDVEVKWENGIFYNRIDKKDPKNGIQPQNSKRKIYVSLETKEIGGTIVATACPKDGCIKALEDESTS